MTSALHADRWFSPKATKKETANQYKKDYDEPIAAVPHSFKT